MSNSIITLYELQTLLCDTVAKSHPMPYWVTAEISELKVNNSGHCYIELIEKVNKNALPRSKVNAVIWRNNYLNLSKAFLQATGATLGCGMKVLIKVLVTYHEIYGMSFQITDIDPSYTLGDAERQRNEAINQLVADGVYDMNRELPLPEYSLQLAIVSSSKAAGYQDFMKEICGSNYRFTCELFEATMQGAAATDSIIYALDCIALRDSEFDAVVLIRGGGSQSDLSCFDDYNLCNNIAQFPLPVVTGIGHDKDVSVADLVAKKSLKTPTAVAQYFMQQADNYYNYLSDLQTKIGQIARKKLNSCNEILNKNIFLLKSYSSDFIRDFDSKLMNLQNNVNYAARQNIVSKKMVLQNTEKNLREKITQYIDNKRKELTMMEIIVDGKTPQRILKMGYSIARTNDKIINSIHDVNAGDKVTLEVIDGKIKLIVK